MKSNKGYKNKVKIDNNKVRISVDSRDASKDYYIDKIEAKKLYDESKLSWDLTNNMYCKP